MRYFLKQDRNTNTELYGELEQSGEKLSEKLLFATTRLQMLWKL